MLIKSCLLPLVMANTVRFKQKKMFEGKIEDPKTTNKTNELNLKVKLI